MFFRNRNAKGNVALVLVFTMAMFLAIGFAPVGQALASSSSVNITNGTGSPLNTGAGTTNTVALNQASSQVTVTFTPTTYPFPGNWGNVLIEYIFQSSGSQVGAPFYVYNSNLTWNVYNASAYTTVYNVYGLPSGYNLNGLDSVYAEVYNGNGILFTVYLDVATPPPQTGGGGGGGGTTTTTTTTTTSVGNTTTTGTTTTDQISTTNMTTALTSTSGSTVNITVNVPSGNTMEASISSGAMSAVANAGKGISVAASSGTTLSLPAAVVSQIAQQVASVQGGTVNITVAPTTASSAPGNSSVAGQVVNLQVSVTVNGQTVASITVPAAPTPLTLTYNTSQVTGDQAKMLVIERADTSSPTGWDYVGGVVNESKGTVTANLNHYSEYGVFRYTGQFADTVSNWANTDIEILAAHQVVNGVGNNNFDPSGQVTRAQFAAMLVRALNLSTAASGATFSDVPSSAWYAASVAAAKAAGIISGYPNGTFGPNQPITRDQMAVMLARAMSAAGQPVSLTSAQVQNTLAPFNDASAVPAWAAGGVAIAVQQGIIQGLPNGTLEPAGNALRDQTAAMVERLMTNLNLL